MCHDFLGASIEYITVCVRTPFSVINCHNVNCWHVFTFFFFFFSIFLLLFAVDFFLPASESVRINRNAFKPPVSEYVKDIVRRNFSREIEFYEFCKDRLYKQYRALRLPTSKSNDASTRYAH